VALVIHALGIEKFDDLEHEGRFLSEAQAVTPAFSLLQNRK
jgi:hypothetical protein